MTIRSITLTGLNESVNLQKVVELTRATKGINVEWGVLYSPDRAGNEPRYPSLDWIQNVKRFAFENQLRIALHVCGRGVEQLLLDNEALKIARGFHRVQLNFDYSAKQYNLTYLDRFMRSIDRPVITQHNDENEYVSRNIAARNHQLLVDSSRGKGISPKSWPLPIAAKSTGYAGGLGPDNLAQALVDIEAVAGSGQYPEHYKSWVDMESKLFSGFMFDLAKAEVCLSIMQAHSARGFEAAVTAADEPLMHV